MKEYASKIRELRHTNSLTQQQMADRLEMLQPAYARLERGILDIRASLIIKICKEFSVSADWLLGLSD